MAGALEKFRIFKIEGDTAKLKLKEQISAAAAGDAFVAMFNPENYSYTRSQVYEPKKAYGETDDPGKWVHSGPKEYSFSLVLDGTGASTDIMNEAISLLPNFVTDKISSVIPDGTAAVVGAAAGLVGLPIVEPLIKHFFKVTGYQGEAHEPNKLLLLWGKLHAKVVLKSVTVNYKLFSPTGNPIRAILDTTFIEIEDPDISKLLQRNSSPDLTHHRVVKQGDTLPLLCKEIYEDESYYIQVAQANGITNFRRLTPGQEIFFPPIVNQQ